MPACIDPHEDRYRPGKKSGALDISSRYAEPGFSPEPWPLPSPHQVSSGRYRLYTTAARKREISAFEGQPIELIFNNLHPDLHNVVLLKAGADITAFGGLLDAYVANPEATENAYIPPAAKDQVIAFTRVLSIEESQSLQIEGLPPGEYPFVCTVPVHWAVMQGVLKIESVN